MVHPEMMRRGGTPIGAVTLRNLSPNVVKIIRQRAAERKTSINKVVAGVLEEGLGLSGGRREPVVHHDLDHLFGSWSRKEADAFDRELARQRIIEPELWK
jgi:hypothetical protein